MANLAGQAQPSDTTISEFVRPAIDDIMNRRRPRRALLISPEPDQLPVPPSGGKFTRVAVSIDSSQSGASLLCDLDGLPIQTDSFELVSPASISRSSRNALIA